MTDQQGQEDPALTKPTLVAADHQFLVYNKPRGWLSHASVDRRRENLLDFASSSAASSSASFPLSVSASPSLSPVHRDPAQTKPLLVNRLDRGTSGLILLARDAASCAKVQSVWSTDHVIKWYLAIIELKLVDPREFLSHFKFGEVTTARHHLKDTGRDKQEIVKSGGQLAVTELLPLRRQDAFLLIAARLRTGRRHQIRAQVAALWGPIVGDSTYGSTHSVESGFLLHSAHLCLQLPGEDAKRSWSVAPPQTGDLLDQLWSQHLKLGSTSDSHFWQDRHQ
jgi:23S rRNA-/tRNA-specific pseudouridylate synthase